MREKSVIAVLAAALLIGAILFGCGDNNGNGGTGGAGSGDTSQGDGTGDVTDNSGAGTTGNGTGGNGGASNGGMGNYSDLKIGQVDYAAHGTRGFCVATAVVEGDRIAACYIDEFQYMPTNSTTPVPNGEANFGQELSDTTNALASKKANNEYYSELMKTNGNATQKIADSYSAIEDYCTGKTVSELDSWSSSEEAGPDAVSGSTLTDTAGYVKAIVEAAKAAR